MSSLGLFLHFDSFHVDIEVPVEKIEAAFRRLVSRNERAQELEEDGIEPIRFWVRCPHCDADGTHLGSKQFDDRKVRLCTRCRSYFEVT